jgi:hypothetical protein
LLEAPAPGDAQNTADTPPPVPPAPEDDDLLISPEDLN